MVDCEKCKEFKDEVKQLIEESVQDDRERGFVVCEKPNGEKTIKKCKIGGKGAVTFPECPTDTKEVLYFHTHPSPPLELSTDDKKATMMRYFLSGTNCECIGVEKGIKKLAQCWEINPDSDETKNIIKRMEEYGGKTKEYNEEVKRYYQMQDISEGEKLLKKLLHKKLFEERKEFQQTKIRITKDIVRNWDKITKLKDDVVVD